ncbi:isochorismatase family protein [Rhodococcus sp. H29-C3]|uniref:isochorismatase family protein n=1 Tax=Rhodococcus sp. H29-C3 TaxID=3046307 RepID=UPI0024BA2E89|nr:isochorismatase family protein [Rhodococcus sp. H29-C3]MDJ0360877.1 isochorismatase family protein [Rhodococcus sp. H29-C3]
MTTLPGRPNTALLVVDVQIDVMASSIGSEAIIANIVRLVDKARAHDVRVVWVQHSSDQLPRGSAGWEYVPELVRKTSEPLLHKIYGDAFEDTDLESVLAEAAIGRLIVAGAQTDQCIRSTLHGALVRGYDTILVSDAHTTEDLTEWGAPPPAEVVSHTNLYWSFQSAPGREAGTTDTESVAF